MMQLACNYSAALLALLDAGRARVDYLKCSRSDLADSEVRSAAGYGPVLTHFLPGMSAPFAEIDAFPWDWLNDLNRDARVPWMAAHLEAFADSPEAAAAPLPPAERDAVGARIVGKAVEVQSRLEVPLHLELVPWSGRRPLLRCCADPDFITAVLTAADCPLLLDTAHARVSAARLGTPIRDYLAALPLHRVVEVHCSGAVEEAGQLRDRHEPLGDEDYALLDWLIDRCAPRVLTLEYGGTGPQWEPRTDAAALEGQLQRLRRFCDTGTLG